jgi:DNA-binding MarR family transcriptional regulator
MSESAERRGARLPAALRDEPLSTRLVYLYLCEVEAATAAELATDLALSLPTVYQARDALREAGLLVVASDPRDGRRDRYALRGAD